MDRCWICNFPLEPAARVTAMWEPLLPTSAPKSTRRDLCALCAYNRGSSDQQTILFLGNLLLVLMYEHR